MKSSMFQYLNNLSSQNKHIQVHKFPSEVKIIKDMKVQQNKISHLFFKQKICQQFIAFMKGKNLTRKYHEVIHQTPNLSYYQCEITWELSYGSFQELKQTANEKYNQQMGQKWGEQILIDLNTTKQTLCWDQTFIEEFYQEQEQSLQRIIKFELDENTYFTKNQDYPEEIYYSNGCEDDCSQASKA